MSSRCGLVRVLTFPALGVEMERSGTDGTRVSSPGSHSGVAAPRGHLW